MQCYGGQEIVTKIKALGFFLSDDGSIEPSWAHAKRGVWKAWWGNLGKGLFRAAIEKQVALLNRVALPVILFHCLLWPWSQTTARRIDALQSHLIARLLRLPERDDEPRHTYWQRRSRAAGDLARRLGTWSDNWSNRVRGWLDHLQRHQTCWVARLLQTRDSTWLQERRTAHLTRAHTATAGRTHTRVIQQRVQRRYETGLIEWRRTARNEGGV